MSPQAYIGSERMLPLPNMKVHFPEFYFNSSDVGDWTPYRAQSFEDKHPATPHHPAMITCERCARTISAERISKLFARAIVQRQIRLSLSLDSHLIGSLRTTSHLRQMV
eukprot:1309709-Pleurochrysis_carterae.AAC.1